MLSVPVSFDLSIGSLLCADLRRLPVPVCQREKVDRLRSEAAGFLVDRLGVDESSWTFAIRLAAASSDELTLDELCWRVSSLERLSSG